MARKVFKSKGSKIAVVSVVIAAVLVAAFFLAPGAIKRPSAEVVGSISTATTPLPSGDSSLATSATTTTASDQTSSDLASNGTTSSTAASDSSADTSSSTSADSTHGNSSSSSSASGSTGSSSDPNSNKSTFTIDPTTGKDQYQTDPVPDGKPLPVEPDDQVIDSSKQYTCTISIDCLTILNNMDLLDKDKLPVLPSDGVILAPITVTYSQGESVFDVLKQVTRDQGIQMQFVWTPIYNSVYIQGIHNLYEFDTGPSSGWMYEVNGWYPNYGCSRYQVQPGDVIQWRYTCSLGDDLPGAKGVMNGYSGS